MNRFNYFKRGVRVHKAPQFSEYLHLPELIAKGAFDESPYWEMSNREGDLYEKELEDYRKSNPHISPDAVMEHRINRRAIFTKRREQLRRSHQDYEQDRLNLLHAMFIKYFEVDVFDQAIERCDNIYQLFTTYKTIVDEIRLQTSERTQGRPD